MPPRLTGSGPLPGNLIVRENNRITHADRIKIGEAKLPFCDDDGDDDDDDDGDEDSGAGEEEIASRSVRRALYNRSGNLSRSRR